MKRDDKKTTNIEDKLLENYGGRGSSGLPQTLMFDHVSPATRLLEKRRQMFEVQEALNSQKEEFSRREDAFRRREDGLRRKDLELQESLIKFNKFLQENESKRNRAIKRGAEEKKQREIKEKEIEQLKIQLTRKKKEENELKIDVERNMKYQEYLENVVNTMSKYFPEISDILNRYKTLRSVNFDLIEKHKSEESTSDLMLREYANLRKSGENTVLNSTNAIADKQVVLEQCRLVNMREQGEIDKVLMEASEKGLELGQIITSVSNILERSEESYRIRHNKPHIDRSIADKEGFQNLPEVCANTEKKLNEIASLMMDYKDIIQEYASTHDFNALSITKLKGGSNAVGSSSMHHHHDITHSKSHNILQLDSSHGTALGTTTVSRSKSTSD